LLPPLPGALLLPLPPIVIGPQLCLRKPKSNKVSGVLVDVQE
jgi:hypothetical protein